MIVDDEEFELELNKSICPAKIVQMDKKGRTSKEVPESLRKLIAGDSLEGAPARLISSTYGISESSISAYKNGATSTSSYDNGNGELAQHVDKVKDRIKNRAQNKLALALKHITEDKLRETKPVDLSSIAANMSRVVDKMTPKEPGNVINNNVIFYSPQQIKKENFEALDLEPTG